MIGCKQKYCKNCIKPVFDEHGRFQFGHCKVSKTLVLDCNDTRDYDAQPLYCYRYEKRKRKIKY